MIDTDIELNDFICEIHPKYMIKYVNETLSAPKRVYCDQCIVESRSEANKSLKDFEKLLQNVQEAIAKIFKLKAESRAPDHILDTLRSREELVLKFSNHIDNMKQKSLKEFDRIEKEIMDVIKKSKENLLYNLDYQLGIFKQNIENYAKKVKRHFDFGERINPPTIQEIYEEMNNCQSYQELEIKLRSYLIELGEAEELVENTVSNRDLVIIDSVNQVRNHILETVQYLPTPTMLQSNFDYTDNLDILKTRVNEFLKPLTTVSGEILSSKALSIDSKITNYSDLGLIRKWINADGEATLKLVSRLKFSSEFDEAIKKALVIPKLLILIRSQEGQVFGCYRILGRSTVTFCLTDQKVNYDLSVNSHPIGLYMLSTTMSFTWKEKCKYNSTLHELIKKYKTEGKLERAICIAKIDLYEDDAAPERAKVQKKYHYVQDLEIFELVS